MAAPDAPGFDPVAFRAGIQFAMQMGLPVDLAEQAIFMMPGPVAASDVDEQGVSWDPELVGENTLPGPELPALCAIEYFDRVGLLTDGVDVQVARLIVTLLDDDYQPVSEAVALRLGGRVYLRDRTRAPSGLFSVGIHQMIFLSGDV